MKIKKSWLDLCQNIFFNFINHKDIKYGDLTIICDEKVWKFKGREDGPKAKMEIKDRSLFPLLIFRGDIGLGEAYMENYYTTNNISDLVSFFILNFNPSKEGNGIVPSIQKVKDYLIHLLHDNRISQSRRNIQRHYDIGNDFYTSFLDPSMMYSSAIFKDDNQNLAEAQINKLDIIIRKAKIRSTDHVLEIGSGWGAFAIRAAITTGCKVTTITISTEQKKLVEEKIKKLKLEEQIEVKLIDYRLIRGVYDKIVSIEMIEAVGHRHLKSYISSLERLLAKDGLVVIQMISMPDYKYTRYRRSSDWIRKYIFPGGHLPSLTDFGQKMVKYSRFHFENIENIAPHYAKTLVEWNKNFQKNSRELAQKKFGDKFIRMWEYYLLSCSAAFSTRYINNIILTLSRDCNLNLSKVSDLSSTMDKKSYYTNHGTEYHSPHNIN